MGKIMKHRFRACLVIILLMLSCFCTNVEASKAEVDRLKEESENATQKVEDIKNQQQQVKDTKSQLETQADSLSGQISNLNNQISTVTGEISETEQDIAAVEADIDKLSDEITTIQKSLDIQKRAMRARIQYMYENKSTNTLVNFLESGSMSGFLQRLEYMSQIVDYDQRAIKKFQETQTALEAKKAEVEEKNQQLSAYKNSLNSKKSQLGNLVGNAATALNTTNGQIADSQAAIEELEKQLQEAKENEKRIRKQYEGAQLALAQRLAGEHGAYKGGYSGSADETTLLAALIQAEADNQGSDGRLAVGSVVMNRVASSKFPNTIAGVIYAPGQFAPVASGRFAIILANGPNKGCIKAAEQTIAGNTNTDALFFFTTSYAQNLHDTQVANGQEGFLDRTEGITIRAHYYYNYK